MIPVRDIADRLSAQAEDAARELLPQGKRIAGEWYASGSRSPLGYAVSVVLKGAKRGVVLFTGGTSKGKSGGDLLDLAEEIFGSKRAGVEWAKAFLGISDERPEQSEAARKAAEKRRKERERQDAAAAQRKQARAQQIWREAKPIQETLAERYLLGRGLSPADWPPTLRFAPLCEWELGGTKGASGAWTPGPFLPALVAAVQSADRHLIAVWRIFLGPDGRKSPLDPCKVGLGPAKGGAVRFGPAAETIGVAEGIETALAIRELVAGAFPIWATLSTSGMASLCLPPCVREVRIFPDSDLPHRNHATGDEGLPPGHRAATTLAARLTEMKIRAVIEESPSVPKEDFLDTLRACHAPRK
jgi:Toprim domain